MEVCLLRKLFDRQDQTNQFRECLNKCSLSILAILNFLTRRKFKNKLIEVNSKTALVSTYRKTQICIKNDSIENNKVAKADINFANGNNK